MSNEKEREDREEKEYLEIKKHAATTLDKCRRFILIFDDEDDDYGIVIGGLTAPLTLGYLEIAKRRTLKDLEEIERVQH